MKYTSKDTFIQKITQTKQDADDITVKMSNLQVSSQIDLTNLANGESFIMDSWAFSQLCTRVDVPVSYMRRCPNDLVAQNVNYWLTRSNKDAVLRAFKSNSTCRAVLSCRYALLDDIDVMQELDKHQDLLKFNYAELDQRHSVTFFDAKQMKAKDLDYSAGIVVRNSEVGAMALSISAAVNVRNHIYESLKLSTRRKHIGDVAKITKQIGDILSGLNSYLLTLDETVITATISKLPEKIIGNIIGKLSEIFGKTYIEERKADIRKEAKQTTVINFAEFIANLADQRKLDPQQEARVSRLCGALIGI